MKKIYVGNLPYDATDDDLRELFAPFGDVATSSIVMDRETGRSRGFGFVEMSDDAQADTAIQSMNGAQVGGRSLTVNEARPKEAGSRPGGGGGGGGGWGRGGSTQSRGGSGRW